MAAGDSARGAEPLGPQEVRVPENGTPADRPGPDPADGFY